jgi:hypothetical protein
LVSGADDADNATFNILSSTMIAENAGPNASCTLRKANRSDMVRGGPIIESTTVGGSAFKKHQIAIKIAWRGG